VGVLTLKWDQRFESAFLQRRVTRELGQLTVPAVEEGRAITFSAFTDSFRSCCSAGSFRGSVAIASPSRRQLVSSSQLSASMNSAQRRYRFLRLCSLDFCFGDVHHRSWNPQSLPLVVLDFEAQPLLVAVGITPRDRLTICNAVLYPSGRQFQPADPFNDISPGARPRPPGEIVAGSRTTQEKAAHSRPHPSRSLLQTFFNLHDAD
jgi:hypothetical protein